MQETIAQYLQQLKAKQHLFELIKNKNLSIVFSINNQEYWFFIRDGQMHLNAEMSVNDELARIAGDKQTISSVLAGELKLRAAEDHDFLKVTANFRNKLLLESLFYLGRQKSS